ncbi:MAG TPA: acyl-CoA synthetase [Longimicrobiales bacterium]|nr:acyl-CoA synthetase [Longimicrobiales bacterium]
MSIAVVRGAAAFGARPAIVDRAGTHDYDALLAAAHGVARALLDDARDLAEARVAFMVEPGFDYVATQWGIWLAGGVAVPLCLSHPEPELDYVLQDTGARLIVASRGQVGRLESLAQRADALLLTAGARSARPAPTAGSAPLPDIGLDRRAMILYTSGTTSRPKGVVTTHGNLLAQIDSLVEAWEWSPHDRILHVLPLHHTHGVLNALLCALGAGASCEMTGGFDAHAVWRRFGAGGITLFMAVPTIYVKLIQAWRDMPRDEAARVAAGCRSLRLMVSGSAALPVTTFEAWRSITGHTLLERYGMTEIGMALSNPLHGERRPGTVGQLLPGVVAELRDEAGAVAAPGDAGEIHVRGPGVFLEYWQRPDATRDAFRDGWFGTGDVALVENGYWRLLGRNSVDIIKTGGYKVSALEIEEALRAHPAVRDCAIVGIEDEEWGERIVAAVVGQGDNVPDESELSGFLASRLAPYKLPRRWLLVDELPRNVMGKVTKPDVKRLFT